jgi:hydroxymethylpyrimidine kinase / phosphomethylpyrimidine kinase / thiamine-phosphate diphosphorylase
MKLHSQYVQAELLPASGFDLNAAPWAAQYQAAFQKRQAEGYVDEDAAVIAIMELDQGRFPVLHDLNASAPRNQNPFPEMRDRVPGIYPIVDNNAQLALLMQAGARIIQLRIKAHALTPEIEAQVREAITISQDFPHSQLFINDYWQAAIEHGAYGVHLGQEDSLCADLQAIQNAGLRLGLSSHCYWEVARALTIAPSYVACGPLFPTRAKKMPWMAQGIDNLRYWVHAIPHPVVGIGGVTSENLNAIRATGCASASIIQAIVADPDPAQALGQLQKQWENAPLLIPKGPPLLARPTLPRS